MNCKTITFFLIFLPMLLVSQVKINGRITSNNTGLKFANITLLDSTEKTFINGTVSDSIGRFEIETKLGSYKLIISHISYENWSQNIQLTQNINLGEIVLTEKEYELNEVVVEGKKLIFAREMNKLIFHVQNSPLKDGYNALELLQRSPKVFVNGNGGISLKNGSPTISINGRKLNLRAGELDIYLSGLNSENIEKIEIQDIRSAELEASSTGGGINIILKKAPKGFSSIINSTFINRENDYDKYAGGISLNFGSNKWSSYAKINYDDNSDLGAVASTATIFDSSIVQENDGFFEQQRKNTSIRAGAVLYPNKKNEFGVEIYFNDSNETIDSNKELNIFSPNLASTANNLSNTDRSTANWYTAINYLIKKDTLGSTIKFIADIGNFDFDNTNLVSVDYSLGDLQNSETRFVSVAEADYNTIQIDWLEKSLPNFNFATGLRNNRIKRDNLLLTQLLVDNDLNPISDGEEDFLNKENVFAGYFSGSFKWNNKSNLKIGIRIENTQIDGLNRINNEEVNQDYTDLFPSLYYGYDFNSKENISFSLARSIARPSFRDLNPFVLKLDDFYYQIGNPELKPQYTNSAEVSYEIGSNNFSFSANYIEDLISPAYTLTDENVRIYQAQNFGAVKKYRLDYNFTGNLKKWIYVNFSLGAQYYDFQTNDNLLEGKRFSINNSIYTGIKLSETTSLNFFNIYFSEFQQHVVRDKGYYKLDTSIEKKLWKGKGLIKISIHDVFDSFRARNISTYSDFSFQFFQKRRTQGLSLFLQYKFDNNKKVNKKSVRSSQTRYRL